MTTQRIHDIMENELRCVQRASVNACDRNCKECNLLMDTDEIIQAYNEIIKIIERMINLQQYDPPYPDIQTAFKPWWSNDNLIPNACKNCSNHPSNGGTGICNCVLGNQVVC